MDVVEKELSLKTNFTGLREVSNGFSAIIVSLGGTGFFVTGLYSFFMDSTEINFLPQGVVLIFYGTVGSILGIFLGLTISWNVGFGYNEYDKRSKTITIYRKTFPGPPKQHKDLIFSLYFYEVKSVKIRIKDGLRPERQLLLCLASGNEIPLLSSVNLIRLEKLENEAITLSKYLNVFVETE
jgi:hypothetical protein